MLVMADLDPIRAAARFQTVELEVAKQIGSRLPYLAAAGREPYPSAMNALLDAIDLGDHATTDKFPRVTAEVLIFAEN